MWNMEWFSFQMIGKQYFEYIFLSWSMFMFWIELGLKDV